jgi:hypothetical protein
MAVTTPTIRGATPMFIFKKWTRGFIVVDAPKDYYNILQYLASDANASFASIA